MATRKAKPVAATAAAKPEPVTPPISDEILARAQKIEAERAKNARGGFWLNGAVWILSRTPFTRNRYQNWTSTRRIIVGWLLWLVTLPIIPIAAIVIWYVHDPEGFKRSPWAKGLIVLALAWASYAGLVITNPSQADANGLYSPVQTTPNGEVAGQASAANTATPDAKRAIEKQSESKPSNGRTFDTCTEAFKAGVFNIKRSDTSYQQKLDRDNDGIACEK